MTFDLRGFILSDSRNSQAHPAETQTRVQLGLQVFHQAFALTLPHKGHLRQVLLGFVATGAHVTSPATAQALQKQANAFLKQTERGATHTVLLGVGVNTLNSAWV